jgi:hypothetical protein
MIRHRDRRNPRRDVVVFPGDDRLLFTQKVLQFSPVA